ncbi:C40 family peptidase [Vibrio sp. JC009]|uniref:C40 family peptidase n=1 Tax=Vibrio sp. JC009 TaxID=2912314 RepID=UPI0023AF2F0D|nr:C40 family peptidase [Vibrio sp. JC009]WED23137.1 C40 family peptidase [Vibrio sp. JC009]
MHHINYQRKTIALSVIASIFVVTGCSTNSSNSAPSSKSISKSAQTFKFNDKNSAYQSVFKEWEGTPYRIGGTSKSGVDCSSFVQSVFLSANNKLLPRTTAHQVKLGVEVPYKNAQVGDLVFFKTSEKSNHVGVYLGDNTFMHASTSKGVIISRLDNPYWSSAFWQMRRVD